MVHCLSLSEEIARKAENGSLIVGVVGLGYVGLPLALAFAKKLRVIGLDTVEEKVAMLRKGVSYIDDIKEVYNDRFEPTTEPAMLSECDVVIVCVPTPLHEDKRPDLGPVKGASSMIARNLRRGQLIILESTTYPGTTEEIMVPLLEKGSGLKALVDFGVAYSPERIDPGNKTYTVENTPKIVGGFTPEWTEAAAKVYGTAISKVMKVADCRTAEMVKIFENVFRNVNIALVNEMALICERMDISVWEVIEAAKTKPYGFMAFYPGPGVGGHCIPLDPYYLSYRARQFDYIPRFIETAGEINDYMPIHVVNRARQGLKKVGKDLHGSKVAVLGIAYKANISDTRESPACKVIDELVEQGAEVRVYDPLARSIATEAGAFASEANLEPTVEWADCLIVMVGHDKLLASLQELKMPGSKVVVDTRNLLKGSVGENTLRLGE